MVWDCTGTFSIGLVANQEGRANSINFADTVIKMPTHIDPAKSWSPVQVTNRPFRGTG